MLTLEIHLYQMHLLTSRKTLSTNKSGDGFKKKKKPKQPSLIHDSI